MGGVKGGCGEGLLRRAGGEEGDDNGGCHYQGGGDDVALGALCDDNFRFHCSVNLKNDYLCLSGAKVVISYKINRTNFQSTTRYLR